MRILFSIEFNFQNKNYLGIVRVMEQQDHVEYHVRVMNARLDRWLYNHHIFRQGPDGTVIYEQFDCSARIKELRDAVHEALKTRLKNQVIAIPPDRRRAGGGSNYYVHRIGNPGN